MGVYMPAGSEFGPFVAFSFRAETAANGNANFWRL